MLAAERSPGHQVQRLLRLSVEFRVGNDDFFLCRTDYTHL